MNQLIFVFYFRMIQQIVMTRVSINKYFFSSKMYNWNV